MERPAPSPQEGISYPISSTSLSDVSSSASRSGKRKEKAPLRSLKKARGQQENYSIRYYLNTNPHMILSRIKNNTLDLSYMNISSLDGLLELPGIATIAHVVLAYNLIKEIKREDFTHLNRLITLDLSNNLIEFLFTDGFAELESLSNLFLNDNIIRTIQHDSFAGLNNLKQLSLSHNRLQEISSAMFTGTFNLEQLDLSNNQIKAIEPFSFVRLTFLKKLKLNDNRLTKLTSDMFDVPKAEGYINTRTGKTHFQLNYLEELDLRNNQLISIPTGIFPHTPALQRLLLAHNQIAKISNPTIAALKKLSSLKMLNVVNNKFSDVELKNIKNGLPTVEVITAIPTEEPILEIEQLANLSREKRVPEQKEPTPRIPIRLPARTSLRTYIDDPSFDFSDHRYTKDNETFYGLDRLNLTSLNGLLELPGIQEVSRLYLDHNKLKTIPARAFAGLNQLKAIILSSNELISFDQHAFENIPHLTAVYLNNNHLSRLHPEVFEQFKNSQTLNLDENQIETLAPFTFKELKKLKTLSLGHNALSVLTPEMLIGLENLERLDIPMNKLSRLDPALFIPLKKLTFLNIQGNPLSKENVTEIKNSLPHVELFF